MDGWLKNLKRSKGIFNCFSRKKAKKFYTSTLFFCSTQTIEIVCNAKEKAKLNSIFKTAAKGAKECPLEDLATIPKFALNMLLQMALEQAAASAASQKDKNKKNKKKGKGKEEEEEEEKEEPSLTFNQFFKIYNAFHPLAKRKTKLQVAFWCFDADNNGSLGAVDLYKTLKVLFTAVPYSTLKEIVKEFLKTCEKTKGEGITIQEFEKVLFLLFFFFTV